MLGKDAARIHNIMILSEQVGFLKNGSGR